MSLSKGLPPVRFPGWLISSLAIRVSERFTAGVRAAPFFSLNDDMSGGAIMRQALEVFLCVGFGEIVAPLEGLIYGRSRGDLSRRGKC